MSIRVVGVHLIDSPQPCHLLEVEADSIEDWNWRDVTQVCDLPRSNWQVAYDEQATSPDGKRWAFFFHYLDFSKKLQTPAGPVDLPEPSPRPSHLSHIEYWEP